MIELYKASPYPMRGLAQAHFDFTLFVGPVTCYYHNCGASQGSIPVAAFCPTDVQMSLGLVEDYVVDAVGEVLAERPEVASLVLLTACQSAFSGVDMEAAARRVEQRFGIVCLHRENNRILLPKAHRDACDERGDRRRRGGKDELAALFSKIPKERVVEGKGLLFLGSAHGLDAGNELFDAARQWGFDWLQVFQELRSRDALDRVRSCELAIVADERMLPLATAMHGTWGLRYVLAPDTCSITEVDALYAELGELCGVHADVSVARSEALRSVERFKAALGPDAEPIEISAPACGVDALRALGIEASLARVPMLGERPRSMRRSPSADRGQGVGATAKGESGGFGCPTDAFALRSGDIHYPTSGPQMRRKGDDTAGLRRRGLPERGAFWGYHGIEDFFTRLAKELI